MIITNGILYSQDIKTDTSNYLPYFINGAKEYNLLIASEAGHASEIERFLAMGVKIETRTAEGATPLVIAVANNHIDAAKLLLYYGADPNVKTNELETPLKIAVLNQNDELAEVLIRYGADINAIDKNNCTPMHYASAYGNIRMVDILLYYEADIDLKAKDGITPLMAAIWSGYSDIAELLIQNGANMEARDYDGFTPFLIAAQNGDTTIMKILIKNGVDVFETNNYNSNAMDMAIRANQKGVVEFLINKDEKWENGSIGTNNPYQVAAKYRRPEILNLLEKYNVHQKKNSGIESISFSYSPLTNFKDFYTGFNISFRGPLRGYGIITGLDTKLWSTKVFLEKGSNTFYQYMDKSSLFYAGVFKDFPLTDNLFRGDIYFNSTIRAGYFFGNELKGTYINPGGKIKIAPSVGLKWIWKNFTIGTDLEYMNSGYDLMAPVWLRFGIGYGIQTDNIKVVPKFIKWF